MLAVGTYHNTYPPTMRLPCHQEHSLTHAVSEERKVVMVLFPLNCTFALNFLMFKSVKNLKVTCFRIHMS